MLLKRTRVFSSDACVLYSSAPPESPRGTQTKAPRIERAHRTGGDNHSGKPKTVVVKFESYKDRDTVIRAARKEKPRDVYVNEDLSQRVMARRRELMPRLREARGQGKIAYLSYNKLVVRDRVECAQSTTT